MTRVSLTFEADSWDDLMARIRAAGQATNSALLQAYEPRPLEEVLKEPEPEAEPPAPPKPKRARAAPPAPTPPEPALNVPEPQPPVTAQAPAPAPEPERELPSLEALKAVVTAAVRAAQKKEGPTTILDLLPAFKAKTKLDFVMNAKDEHRPALADLIEGAGLALEPA
jgi:hypothetical protein